MDQNRVKDPLGDYERRQEVIGPDTTHTGWKLAVLLPLCVLGIAGGVWAFFDVLRSLFA
jgi:hypothetical protein